MSFNYKRTPSGIELTPQIEQLLEGIDNKPYCLGAYNSLGDLHSGRPIDVVLSEELRMISRPLKMTESEMRERLGKIESLLEKVHNKMEALECSKPSSESKMANWCNMLNQLECKYQSLQHQKKDINEALNKRTNTLNATMTLGGKYANNEVTLYIHSLDNDPFAYAVVYVHEMMHAYLDMGYSNVSEVEEPIVEFAMLKFLEAFGNQQLFDYALRNVESKKYDFGFAYYGFGAYLFKVLDVKIVEDYGKAKPIQSCKELDDYLSFWEKGEYPFLKELGCLHALDILIHCKKTTTKTNGIFNSLAECQKAIDIFKANSIPVPQDWYDQEQIFLSGGTPSASIPMPPTLTNSSWAIPVSIYDYMKTHTPYSQELQKCIEDTVDHLLNPSDPNDDTSIPGLLLGRIQSGKTRAFIGVMSLAFDNGFDACIVLTKPDDGLVAQTKARLEDEFAYFTDDTNPCTQNVIAIYDVNKNTSLSARQLRFKNIFVLHKNCRLDIMKRILDQSFAGKKVLIIDDEADFVTRTFYSRRNQTAAGRTGFRLDELMSNPQIDCYYLQVTATPYSLFLQPNDVIDVENGTLSCFRPRFTVLVPTHKDYVGGKEYFEDSKHFWSMYSKLFHPINDECFDYLLMKNRDARVTSHPESHKAFADLRQALASYFVASAIRQIQVLRSVRKTYKTSMLIHCAIEKGDHTYQQEIINKILTYWAAEVNQGNWPNFNALPDEFTAAYKDFVGSINLGGLSHEFYQNPYIPSKDEVYNKLKAIFDQTEYTVKCVNGDTSDDPNLYMKNGQLKLTSLLNMFIGGYKADRGITIDHMIAFAYGRRPQKGGAANTILQHMRQYGNRSKEDMSVTRFHTTAAVYQRLEAIYHTDEALRDIFENNATPQTVCIEKDPTSTFRLCHPNQVRMSDMYGFVKFCRIIATGGMQTRPSISKAVSTLEAELRASEPNEKTPFRVSKAKAIDWIHRIREMFLYDDPKCDNKGIEWDEEIMIAAIEKYCPADGEIWCYYRLNMGISRIHSGRFSDSPDDGKEDTPIARQKADDRPFLMLIGEKGDKDSGWLGDPFFWPVLRLPNNAPSSVYCHGVVNAPRTNSRIEVTLPSGSIVAPSASVIDTMVECIKLADPLKVRNLGIVYRSNNLVYEAGRCPKDYKTIIPGRFFLRKGFTVKQAEVILTEISNQLKLGWSVQINNN